VVQVFPGDLVDPQSAVVGQCAAAWHRAAGAGSGPEVAAESSEAEVEARGMSAVPTTQAALVDVGVRVAELEDVVEFGQVAAVVGGRPFSARHPSDMPAAKLP